MNKHFSIEQLDKKPPFKVPEGYFESLTSRVMAQIPDVSADAGKAEKTVMKPKTKVVGLMPHKTKRPWVKWAVAAAACLCGVGFFLSQQVGVEDLFSAISFLDENKEELGIDPANLVVAGSSAGAIIAQAAEYDILCGRTEGLPEGFQFKGVMAFAGAVISTSGEPKYKQAPCPVLMLHGTADQAVAYHKLSAGGRGIWGSDFLAAQWAKKGYKGYCIYRFQDRTHDVASYMNYLWDLEQAFLEKNVILGIARTVDATVDDPSLPSWGQVSLDSIYRR